MALISRGNNLIRRTPFALSSNLAPTPPPPQQLSQPFPCLSLSHSSLLLAGKSKNQKPWSPSDDYLRSGPYLLIYLLLSILSVPAQNLNLSCLNCLFTGLWWFLWDVTMFGRWSVLPSSCLRGWGGGEEGLLQGCCQNDLDFAHRGHASGPPEWGHQLKTVANFLKGQY